MSFESIVPFEFESHNVRIRIDEQGKEWWVLSDVCAALDITNSRKAATRLDPDDVTLSYIIDALGREQKITFINESGLYTLILRSRKPEAKAFKHWVTNDVLPAIRKTGSYSLNKPVVKNLDRQALIYALMRVDALEQQQHEELEQRVNLLETAHYPPPGKYTTQGFAAAFNKPRMSRMRWRQFNQLCWHRKRAVPYYSVETLEWAFQEAFLGEKKP